MCWRRVNRRTHEASVDTARNPLSRHKRATVIEADITLIGRADEVIK